MVFYHVDRGAGNLVDSGKSLMISMVKGMVADRFRQR